MKMVKNSKSTTILVYFKTMTKLVREFEHQTQSSKSMAESPQNLVICIGHQFLTYAMGRLSIHDPFLYIISRERSFFDKFFIDQIMKSRSIF